MSHMNISALTPVRCSLKVSLKNNFHTVHVLFIWAFLYVPIDKVLIILDSDHVIRTHLQKEKINKKVKIQTRTMCLKSMRVLRSHSFEFLHFRRDGNAASASDARRRVEAASTPVIGRSEYLTRPSPLCSAEIPLENVLDFSPQIFWFFPPARPLVGDFYWWLTTIGQQQ